MFEWTDPNKVKNYTQYYLYLLFSYQGRIGRADFARGFFLGYLGLVLILYISIFALMLVFTIIFGENNFWIALLLGLLAIIFSVIPPLFLIQKRLKDMGFSEDARALIIFGAVIGTIAWLLGPIILVLMCLAMWEQNYYNPYGEKCTLYEELHHRKVDLVNAAKSCLGRNDFKGAIQSYTELGDSKSVQETKKAHLSYNYDLLYSQVSRMYDKGVLCEDLANSTDDLSSLVNSYLGIKSQKLPKTESKTGVSK